MRLPESRSALPTVPIAAEVQCDRGVARPHVATSVASPRRFAEPVHSDSLLAPPSLDRSPIEPPPATSPRHSDRVGLHDRCLPEHPPASQTLCEIARASTTTSETSRIARPSCPAMFALAPAGLVVSDKATPSAGTCRAIPVRARAPLRKPSAHR